MKFFRLHGAVFIFELLIFLICNINKIIGMPMPSPNAGMPAPPHAAGPYGAPPSMPQPGMGYPSTGHLSFGVSLTFILKGSSV